MKLTFKDLENKKVTMIPEGDIQSFSEKTLVYIKSLLKDEEITTEDIEEVLISNILESAASINKLNETIFVCEPEIGAFFWQVICDKDVIILDSYTVDMDNQELILNSTCELSYLGNDMCDIKIEIQNSPEEDLKSHENLAVIRLSILSRLCFYMLTLEELN